MEMFVRCESMLDDVRRRCKALGIDLGKNQDAKR